MASRHSLLTANATPVGTGDQSVIAAVTSPGPRSIVVIAIALVASAATVVSFKSGANVLTGSLSLAANGGFTIAAPGDESYLFKTNPGEALVISQTVDGVDGFITYYTT